MVAVGVSVAVAVAVAVAKGVAGGNGRGVAVALLETAVAVDGDRVGGGTAAAGSPGVAEQAATGRVMPARAKNISTLDLFTTVTDPVVRLPTSGRRPATFRAGASYF
jgi:hypothetical protein